MKTLFIGGSLSGKRVSIPSAVNTHRHKPTIKLPPEILPGSVPHLPDIEEVYIRANFNCGPVTFSMFLHPSIRPEHVVEILKLAHGQEKT